MLTNLLALKGIFLGVWFLIFFAAERILQSSPAPKSPSRIFKNISLWLLTVLLSIGIVAPLTAWGANGVIWDRHFPVFDGGTGAAITILDLLILDCWVYWVHRAYHRLPILWRLHEIHHRDQFLDSTSAVRFHVGEVAVSSALRLIPIAFLAIPLETVILFEVILLSASIFQHSNLKLSPTLERFLARFLVTPSIHWVHHHAIRDDTDSNYASVLSFWDLVFRTRSPTMRTPDMKIGVEGVEDVAFIRLLLLPFRRENL